MSTLRLLSTCQMRLAGSVLLAIFTIASLTAAPTAHACSCDYLGLEQQYERSESVVRVRIEERRIRRTADLHKQIDPMATEGLLFGEPEYAELRYKVLETFKKSKNLPAVLREGVEQRGMCNIGLGKGIEYVVFIGPNSEGFVSLCGGTFWANDHKLPEVAKQLSSLRELAKVSAGKTDTEEDGIDCESPPNTREARWHCARRFWGASDMHPAMRECGPWCTPKILSAAKDAAATRVLVEKIRRREVGSLWLGDQKRMGKALEFTCLEFAPPKSKQSLLICPLRDQVFCGTGGCPVYFLSQRPGKAVEVHQDFALMFYTPGQEELESGRAYFGTISSGGDSVAMEEQYLWKDYLP